MNYKFRKLFITGIISVFIVFNSCDSGDEPKTNDAAMTQAEKLGFEKGKKILIIHADDIGMCEEANIAAKQYLGENQIQSISLMAPCPAVDEMTEWLKENKGFDAGIHLTLTSEWKTYRWSSVTPKELVPGLIDGKGMLWPDVLSVVANAHVVEVEKEIRAQIDKVINSGFRPTHLDSHMGTVFAHYSFLDVYLKIAEEYNIPATVPDLSKPELVEYYKEKGFPINEDYIKRVVQYEMPKLDNYLTVPEGNTYEELRENFLGELSSLGPGITEFYFHPSAYSEELKEITNSWQRRVWEAELFSDPLVHKFFEENNIGFTNWIEIMSLHKT
ncbi:MAG: polysaccharide deacetylase family protein [Bacteroidota bacterium]